MVDLPDDEISLSGSMTLTFFLTIMAYYFLGLNVYFYSFVSVFMYLSDLEPFAPPERRCDFSKFWCGKTTGGCYMVDTAENLMCLLVYYNCISDNSCNCIRHDHA